VNSEELEQSLRTEFEGYLKSVLADMTQEVSQFQQKIDTELEKHKSHLDVVFQEFSTRIQTQRDLDAGFKESVVEHLRLARDEGARITATAIAEAEELTKSEQKAVVETAPSVELSDIRDAINDISSQNSQSSILKSLITHAAKYTPRGAFFVVKNQHFVGWRVFGSEDNIEVETITDIVFPLSNSTILGESVNSLGAIESVYGTYADDSVYLDQLEFSEPNRIFAIPLIARGRGVAAIYADSGVGSGDVNLEALETLVSVAGLTVELLAAAQSSNYSREPAKPSSFVAAPQTVESSEESEAVAPTQVHVEEVEEVEDSTGYQYADADSDAVAEVESDSTYEFSDDESVDETVSEVEVAETASESDVEEVSYQFSEDTEVEEDTLEPSLDREADVVYETASEAEATELVEESVPVVEETYSFSDETVSADEDDVSDYAVYDDDLIEEVQTSQATEVVDEVEVAAGDEVDTIETVAEVSDGYSNESEYDFASFESEVEEITEVKRSDDFSAPAKYAEFETNQDFNSTHVQFEAPAETTRADEFDSAEIMDDEDVVSDEIEEVSFVEPEPAVVKEFSVESFVEEVHKPEPQVAAPVIKTRFSDRNLDLPIEVNEDERRLHNDARRFARLLVSEIKLYNEQKVKEGREAGDLYDRLREALDRSREMYDKRVQPAVVERFDYFHHEVVSTLAEGEESKLGAAYPGSAVAV
jgi:hypothetical protein